MSRPYRTLLTLPDGREVTRATLAKELGITRAALYERLQRGADSVQLQAPRYQHVHPDSGGVRPGAGRPCGVTNHHQDAIDLAPEQALVAAVLRCAVQDARRVGGKHQAEARAWLRDKATVLAWLNMAGLPETTYDALLRAAAVESPS